jgi:hypothetical protein
MNKKDRQQLEASIARDLIQDQGAHTATRELLKQYAPLEGVITALTNGASMRPKPSPPVEKTLAHDTTVAPERDSPWHAAKEASPATAVPDATLARLAVVKGELRVPNTINFSLFPTLDPFAKAVYYQLYLLSHGFRRDTCVVGLAKLAKSVLMSQRKVQDTILYLEKRGLIRRLRAILGGPSKGNVYQVPIPAAESAPGSTVANDTTVAEGATLNDGAAVAPSACVAPHATNKDDDDYKKQSSSNRGRTISSAVGRPENHSGAAAPREKHEISDGDFAVIRATYKRVTGNRWSQSDSETYAEHGLDQVPVERIIAALEAVSQRSPVKINSFKYFVKEITALPDPRNRAPRKKQLGNIVRRIRENSVGRADCSEIDFREDVKCACAREAVAFDNDIYDELVSRRSSADIREDSHYR